MAAQTVPMFSSDGSLGDIPYEQMGAARQAGFKPAVVMKSADGSSGYVPADRMVEASKSGMQIVPIHEQETQHPGFWHSLFSDFTMPGGVSPYPGMDVDAKQAIATQSGAEDQARKNEGYSLPYRVAAGATGAIAPIGAMEQSAREGDVGGVAGHMVAGQTMAATPLIAEGASKVASELKPSIIGAKTRAGNAFNAVEFAAGDAPVDHGQVLGALERVNDLTKKGFTAPKVATDFQKWVDADGKPTLTPQGNVDPLAPPKLVLKDARDFYTAFNESIDWNQVPGGKGGKMGLAMKQSRVALDNSIMDSLKQHDAVNGTDLVGQYQGAKADYHRALNFEQKGYGIGKIAGKLTGYGVGAGVTGHPLMTGYLGGQVGADAGSSLTSSIVNAGDKNIPSSRVSSTAPKSLKLMEARQAAQTPAPAPESASRGTPAFTGTDTGLKGNPMDTPRGTGGLNPSATPPKLTAVPTPEYDPGTSAEDVGQKARKGVKEMTRAETEKAVRVRTPEEEADTAAWVKAKDAGDDQTMGEIESRMASRGKSLKLKQAKDSK